MAKIIYHPQILQKRLVRFAEQGEVVQPVFSAIAERLCERLLDIKYNFNLSLDLGSGFGGVANSFPENKTSKHLIELDLSLPVLEKNNGRMRVSANAEMPLPFADKTFDLVISNLLLPWINNPTRFLAQAGRVLKDDGLFLASTIGQESFWQLRQAFIKAGSTNQHINPLPDIQTAGQILQSVGFALPAIDRDLITLKYSSFNDLWRDFKAIGATNMHPERNKGITTPQLLRNVEKHYTDLFALPDGQIPLTLEVIYLHGWRPHHSQQKPLPRGSAKVDLSEVL